jgi:hypothetical protein
MRLVTITRARAKQLRLPKERAGFQIPYFDLRGRPTSFWRIRYLEDTLTGFDKLAGKRALRYVQPEDSNSEVYLPPLIDWAAFARDANRPLVITEGELKSACATHHGIPAVGLGGVWSFMSKRNNTALLPQLEELQLRDRECIICFDSDVVTNPQVVSAEIALAKQLTARGARVRVARIPMYEEARKMGLDDYIVLNSVEDFKRKVLELAFDYAESSVLHELNQKVVYVRNPGFVYDHEHQLRMPPVHFTGHAYANLFYTERRLGADGQIRLRQVPAAKAWIEWPHRAEVPSTTYAPGQPSITEDGRLNMWLRWGVAQPLPGNVQPWIEMMDHIFGPEPTAERRWFEQWCAYPIQHPGAKLASAVLIWSPTEGAGKTLVGHTLMRLYGENAAEVKDADIEDERFEWADRKQFALADDITGSDSRKLASRLRTMITQKWVRLNPKFVPSYLVPDCINYYFTSNEPDAFYMSMKDRRYFIHEVRGGELPAQLRRAFVRWRDSEEGIAALWDYLLRYDMEGFDPQERAPMTAAKEQMLTVSRTELGAWVHELRVNTDSLLAQFKLRGDLFTAKELYAAFDPAGTKRSSPNALARELRRAGFRSPATGSQLRLRDGRQMVVYAIRNPAKWDDKSSWKEACAHYEANHPAHPSKMPKF